MVFEMERRYRLLAEKGVRKLIPSTGWFADEECSPTVVIFIDELADLMFTSANEVEDSIARLRRWRGHPAYNFISAHAEAVR